MSPVTKRGCLSNRQFRVSGFRVHGDPADARCHSHNTCILFGRLGRIVDEYRPRGYVYGSITGGTSDLEIRVCSIRQSATFFALVPSGRNSAAVRPSPDSQGESVPLSRLHLSSVSGRCARCAKKHKTVVCPYLIVVAPRRLLRRSGIFLHQAINRSTASAVNSFLDA
jgi:hypothetical protein